MKIHLKVNGKDFVFEIKGNETLLHVLRENGFTEVKCGCEEGTCGACVVLLDDRPVNSCQVLAGSADGCEVKTVKGIDADVIINAFVDAGAVQCGFCTPGMVLSTYSLLSKNPNPSEEEIKKALDGNLCRCTGYVKIIEGVKLAAKRLKNV